MQGPFTKPLWTNQCAALRIRKDQQTTIEPQDTSPQGSRPTVELEVLIVNIAYATYAATALCHRVRTLRSVLLASSILFAGFGLVTGILSIIAWNLGLAILSGRSLQENRSRARTTGPAPSRQQPTWASRPVSRHHSARPGQQPPDNA